MTESEIAHTLGRLEAMMTSVLAICQRLETENIAIKAALDSNDKDVRQHIADENRAIKVDLAALQNRVAAVEDDLATMNVERNTYSKVLGWGVGATSVVWAVVTQFGGAMAKLFGF